MTLIVNGERIDDSLIETEVQRLRPDYQKVFQDQTPDEQETQLRDWAKENVIERILIQQIARKDPRTIPAKEINKAYQKMKEEHGGEESFYKKFGMTKAQDPEAKKELELQLRVERLIREVTGDVPTPSEEQARDHFDNNREKYMTPEQIRAVDFEKVKQNIIEQLHEEDRNKKVEDFVDELKEKAEIILFAPEQKRLFINKMAKSGREQTSLASRKPLNSILVKPAGPDCNMACTYCFYLEKGELFPENKNHRMREAVLKEMIKQALEQSGTRISFGWQGGEPTLMGLPFFEKAVEFQKMYGQGQIVGNGLQTNGILVDEKWAKFLKEYNFLVGLSLDGPEHIHDLYRSMRGGKGSWNRVVKSAKLMLDHDVAVNALSVVNDYSVQFPKEIYEFHKELGLSFQQYIPCVETDREDPMKSAPFSVSSEAYGAFLCTLFDLWLSDFKNGEPTTSIRFFDSVFYGYVGAPPPECTLLPECGVYVVVEHNGNVYSCDFFVESEWQLGNILDNYLVDMLNSSRQRAFGKIKAEIHDTCRNCPWLKHCRGGCPKDRSRNPGDQNLSHFCGSYKMFFEHADTRMKRLAENWKREQGRNEKRDSVLRAIEKGEIKVGRNDPCPCGSGKKFKTCCGTV